MKVAKFGRIFCDESGELNINGFGLLVQNDDEIGQENNPEFIIPAVISHLQEYCSISNNKRFYSHSTSEMIVAKAIEKARSEGKR